MGQVIELPKRRKHTPNAVNRKVAPPRRTLNTDTRSREYLTPTEIEAMLEGTTGSLRAPRPNLLLVHVPPWASRH